MKWCRKLFLSFSLFFSKAQHIERKVQNFISTRTSAPHVAAVLGQATHRPVLSDPKSNCAELRAIQEGIYCADNGSVDLFSAKCLINRYILSLPVDPALRSSKASFLANLASYTDNEIHLPSHLPAKIRTVVLPEAYSGRSKREKEQILALMACVRLHSYGLLSSRLLPLSRRDVQLKIMGKIEDKPSNVSVPLLGSFAVKGASERRKFYVYPICQSNARMARLFHLLRSKGHSLAIISTEVLPPIPGMVVHHATFGMVTCSIGDMLSVECTEKEFEIIVRFFKLMFDSRWRRRTKNVFFRPKQFNKLVAAKPSLFIGCISAASQLDFQMMDLLLIESRRSEAERINAVRSASDITGLPEPRLWAPLYDKNCSYISFGPSCDAGTEFPTADAVEGFKTYSDYFKICKGLDVSGKLFDAKRLWALPFSRADQDAREGGSFEPNKRFAGEHPEHGVCEDLKSLVLPRNACMELPMANPNFLLLCTYLPQVRAINLAHCY